MRSKLIYLMLLIGSLHRYSEAAERPNIVWITSEDNGTYIGCYGDRNARTPNIDSIAKGGVRYLNCFANAPVCAVARSTWIQGVPAVSSGTHHMRSRYRVPDSLAPYPVLLRQAGYYATNNSKTDYNTSSFEKDIWDECGPKAHYKNRDPGKPFFAVFNVFPSHEGEIFDTRYPKAYSDPPATPADGIKVPPYQTASPETVKDWQRVYDRLVDMDNQVGGILRDLEESGEAENTIVVYCSDHGGITLRSKRYLYDSGIRVPLVVYVPEKWKHLAPGKPGSTNDRVCQFLDFPRTWLSVTGAEVPDRMTGRVMLGEDMEPAPESVFLYSGRFDEAPDTRRGVTDGRWKYIRNYEPDRPRFQMLAFPLGQASQVAQWEAFKEGRTNPAQSAQFLPQSAEELYDTKNDPHEINNLASDSKYAAQLGNMRGLLNRHILDNRDVGFIPEPMMVEIDKDQSTTIFEFAQSDATYPLADILKLASLASMQNAANISTLRKNLHEENPIIRYWAVVGLRVLDADALPASKELMTAALDDEEASVRINAAIALGNLGQREVAIKRLIAEATTVESDIHSLWALDGIKYLNAPEAVEELKSRTLFKGTYSKRTYEHLVKGGTMTQPAGK